MDFTRCLKQEHRCSLERERDWRWTDACNSLKMSHWARFSRCISNDSSIVRNLLINLRIVSLFKITRARPSSMNKDQRSSDLLGNCSLYYANLIRANRSTSKTVCLKCLRWWKSLFFHYLSTVGKVKEKRDASLSSLSADLEHVGYFLNKVSSVKTDMLEDYWVRDFKVDRISRTSPFQSVHDTRQNKDPKRRRSRTSLTLLARLKFVRGSSRRC